MTTIVSHIACNLSRTIVPLENRRQSASAWGLSLGIHAFALTGAIAVFHDLPELRPPAYRLEILLGAPSDNQTERVPSVTAAAPSPMSARRSATSAAAQPNPSPSPTEPAPARQAASAAESLLQAESTATTPPAHPHHPSAPAPAPALEEVARPVERSIAPPEPQVAVTSSEPIIPEPGPSPSVEQPVLQPSTDDAQSIAVAQHDTSVEAAPSFARSEEHEPASRLDPWHDSAPSAPLSQTSALPPPQPLANTSPPGASRSSGGNAPAHAAESGEASTVATPPAVVTMNHPPIMRNIPVQPDFGWLKDLLKRKIKGLQAYPRLARMQGWEGLVVIKATIKSDGSLLAATVTNSSGYASLDDDALQLIQRACPIHLQQELGQSQIDVFVPVHYRLE